MEVSYSPMLLEPQDKIPLTDSFLWVLRQIQLE